MEVHFRTIALALTFFFAGWITVSAAPGDLDPTFGNGGKLTDIITPGGYDVAINTAIQPDGKIVVVGTGNIQGITVVRYNPDGSRDLNFGGTGKVEISLPNFAGFHIAIQPDGKIVVSGNDWDSGPGVLARLNPNGALDATFGNAGIVSAISGAGAVAIQTDGRIVVRTFWGLGRYNSNGSIDSSFGVDGFAESPLGLSDETVLQPDGKILVAAIAYTDPDFYRSALVRFDKNGILDPGFGDNGVALTSDISGRSFPHAVAIQPDGKVLVAGDKSNGNDNQGWKYHFAVSRFLPNGSIDPSFGPNGTVTTEVNPDQDFAQSLVVEPSGRIVVSGYTDSLSGSDFAVVGYLPNGNLDRTFGRGDGIALIDFNESRDRAFGMKLDGHGRAVVVGESNGAIALSRLKLGSSTSFDFDGDGKSDFSVWRPGNGTWFLGLSESGTMQVQPWGFASDRIVPADYDGDGKTDMAVYRPTEGKWFVIYSATATINTITFGLDGDTPLPQDFDGDGRADFGIWRPANGTWYLGLTKSGSMYVLPFGLNGDKPVPSDYDGDGKAEIAVWRPTEGRWYIGNIFTGGFSTFDLGLNADIPISGDFSGDAKSDYTVYRPSNQTWYRVHTDNFQVVERQWGTVNDIPTPGDFDGDGKLDIAVFRPSEGKWYVLTANSQITQTFGLNGDLPTESAFVY